MSSLLLLGRIRPLTTPLGHLRGGLSRSDLLLGRGSRGLWDGHGWLDGSIVMGLVLRLLMVLLMLLLWMLTWVWLLMLLMLLLLGMLLMMWLLLMLLGMPGVMLLGMLLLAGRVLRLRSITSEVRATRHIGLVCVRGTARLIMVSTVPGGEENSEEQ